MPRIDLVMTWTFFPDRAAASFRRGLPADEATGARARGWALWKALITLGKGGHDDGAVRDSSGDLSISRGRRSPPAPLSPIPM
jgi:aminoglycoside phosphotransferase (APT) family kinase protein